MLSTPAPADPDTMSRGSADADLAELQLTTPSTVPTLKPRPNDPKMGTTHETYSGSNDYYYTFGGKPKADWSDIANIDQRIISDNSVRAIDPVSGQKAAKYRQTGLRKKFESSHSLADFQKEIWDHLVQHGLDTVSYLQDPRNTSDVLSVVTHHSQFTPDLAVAERSSLLFKSRFDIWDKKHDNEAKRFLTNSLSESVRKDFNPFQNELDTFAMDWLRFVHWLVTKNAGTYDRIKSDIRTQTPQLFEGQNIEALSKVYINRAEELLQAGHYEHSLTLNMIEGFLLAEKDQSNSFHHAMNTLRDKVQHLVQLTTFMSKEQQEQKFAIEKCSYKDVCVKAVSVYKDLIDRRLWEPAKLPTDRATYRPSTNVAQIAAAISDKKLTDAQLLVLLENMHDEQKTNARKKISCHNCGGNHYVRNCPKLNNQSSQSSSKFSSQNRRHKSMSKWKLIAPKSGESETRTVNGKVYYWCQKCGNWTPTHSTSTHTGQRVKKEDNKKQASSNLAMIDPSAWIATATKTPKRQSSWSIVPILQAVYILLTLGYFITTSSTAHSFIHLCSDTIGQFISSTWSHPCTNWLVSNFNMLLAPTLWFCLGYTTCSITTSPTNDDIKNSAIHRSMRRQRDKYKPNNNLKLKSIKQHRLHRSYPLRLRTNNVFKVREEAPSVTKRNLDKLVNDCLNETYCPPHRRPLKRAPAYQKKNNQSWKKQCFEKYAGHHRRGSCNQRRNRRFHRQFKRCPKTFQRHPTPSAPPLPTHQPFVPKYVKIPTYSPTGVPTAKRQPNHGYTTSQRRHLKHKATQQVFMMNAASNNNHSSHILKKVTSLSPSCFKSCLCARKKPTFSLI